LFEVIGALGASGSLADLLDSGQEQANQDGNDGDHHQQLDQRETQGKGTQVQTTSHGIPSRKMMKKIANTAIKGFSNRGKE